jgi:hypothetical protein
MIYISCQDYCGKTLSFHFTNTGIIPDIMTSVGGAALAPAAVKTLCMHIENMKEKMCTAQPNMVNFEVMVNG